MNYEVIKMCISEMAGMAHVGGNMTDCEKAEELFDEIKSILEHLIEDLTIMQKNDNISARYDDKQREKNEQEQIIIDNHQKRCIKVQVIDKIEQQVQHCMRMYENDLLETKLIDLIFEWYFKGCLTGKSDQIK